MSRLGWWMTRSTPTLPLHRCGTGAAVSRQQLAIREGESCCACLVARPCPCGPPQTLSWCLEAAAYLGIPSATLPPLWAGIAAAPFLPLSDALYAGGPVHPEHAGYAGKQINQADGAAELWRKW
jgi:hypothetical protein